MSAAAAARRLVPALVDVAWVHAHLDAVVLLEVGEDATGYHVGHLPGAGSLDWGDELQEPVARGFVQQPGFEALMDAKGVSREDHVVLYGEDDPAYAASAYWLLRYYGHPRVSLLDGGKPAWSRAGGRLVDRPSGRPPTSGYAAADPDAALRATRDDVLRRFVGATGDAVMIDCRSPHEFSGVPEHPLDLPLERHRVPGHVPGARNLPSTELFAPDGTLRAAVELRRLFAERGVQAGGTQEVALYCRLSERSSLLWFVLHELLEHPAVRNYDGGWVEYGSLIHVPVER